MKFSVAALAFVAVPLALVVACGGENSPADNCREFLDLTTDCAEQAGRPLGTNAAACDDPSIEQPRTQAQMVCAIQNAPAYCATLKASLTGAATPELARDPAVIKLNACAVAFTAAEPCKAAILALGDCGAAIGLANTDTCTGQVATLSRCILDHKAGACSLYKPVERTQQTLTPDETAFQACVVKASQPDAGRD